jgi:hypothetical protein
MRRALDARRILFDSTILVVTLSCGLSLPVHAAKAVSADASPSVTIPPGPAVDREQFRVHRPLPDAPRGVTVLILDAHALARRRGLADVRIVDAESRQIPYVVEDRPEPISVTLPVPKAQTRAGESVYELALPYSAWPAGTRIALETSGRVFERSVLVRTRPDSHRNRRRVDLARAVWRGTEADAAAPPLTLDLALRASPSIEVVVDEGDNAPLPITRARLLVPARALRFQHPGTPLVMLYGNPRAAAPRYDRALLTRELISRPARELELPPPPPGSDADEDAKDRRLFWAAVVLAGAVVIVMLLRLLLVRPETSRAPTDTT